MSPTIILSPGDQLGGYVIDDVVGIGGMAVVYRARQTSLDRRVALKVLAPHLNRDASFRARFKREGIVAAGLEHPHIVPVYEAGEEDGRAFIAMRFVEGDTLADHIVSGTLSGGEALRMLAGIADALDCAHAAGLVHRDVKPQNILITSTGHAYLADFGVAKGNETGGLTSTGQFIGSVNYASPEQIRGEPLTPRSDVYSLAVVVFQALTGRVPFVRDTEAGVMHAHLTTPPPGLRDLAGDDVPDELDELVKAGLAKDPDARMERSSALLEAIIAAVREHAPERLTETPAFPPIEAAEAGEAGEAGQAAEAPTPVVASVPDVTVAPPAPAASETIIDRARTAPPPEAPPAPPRRRLPRWAVAAGAGAAIVVAVLLGLAFAPSDHASAQTVRTADGLSVTAPASWAPLHSVPSTLTGGRGLAVPGAAGASLVLGRLASDDGSRDPVPAALRPPDVTPTAVTLGRTPMLRYTGRDGTSTVDTRALLTPRGWLVASCRTPAAQAAACRGALDRLNVSGPVSSPVPDAKLAAATAEAMTTLVHARATARHGLSAGRLTARARPASALAAAHTRAARTLRTVDAGPLDRAAVKAAIAALTAEATAYQRLASAAHRIERTRYDGRRAAVARADARLRRALHRLDHTGYDVTSSTAKESR